ncbi:hypothetical protein, partial [Streptomyces sp. CC77]|uniref:hypothetical protein n=1 Tax=Streptomyces sp. CC77 TaxID=1906739 RepID=UPI001C316FD1
VDQGAGDGGVLGRVEPLPRGEPGPAGVVPADGVEKADPAGGCRGPVGSRWVRRWAWRDRIGRSFS